MKKLFILLITACMSLSLSAQNYLVIKPGGGISNLMGNSPYVISPGTMISFGAGYKHQIYNRVILEGNINFESRSALISPYTIIGGQPYDWEIKASYITMPLTIHWVMPFTKKKLVPYRTEEYKTFWYIEGGPQLGFGFGGTTIGDVISETDPKVGGFDAGVVGGIGINFALPNTLHRITLGGRGYYGFLNYNHYDGAPKSTWMTAGGYLGIDFKLNKKQHYRYRM